MPVQLIITLDEAGNIGVNGPIGNKLLSYGLLEAARDAIQAHQEQNKRLIQPATFGGMLPPAPGSDQGNG